MINSGLPLLRALRILSEQTESKELARVLSEVRADVEGGTALSAAMAKYSPKVFPPLMVNMTRAGEVGGFLDCRPAAGGRELRGRGQAARQGEERDDLPGRRLHHGDPHVSSRCCCSSSRCSRRCSTSLGGQAAGPHPDPDGRQQHPEDRTSRSADRPDRRSSSCGRRSSTTTRCATSSTRSS